MKIHHHLKKLLACTAIMAACTYTTVKAEDSVTYTYTLNGKTVEWDSDGDDVVEHASVSGGHTVTVSGVNTPTTDLYGSYSENEDGEASSNNKVTIQGGAVLSLVHGGRTWWGTAENNRVEVSGESTVVSTVDGGSVLMEGVSAGNQVIISDGALVKGSVSGGRVDVDFGDGLSINNQVTVDRATVNGDVMGGWNNIGEGEVTGNRVTLQHATIGRNVYGGKGGNFNDACNNHVTLDGGSISGKVYGGYSSQGNATGNTVTLKSGDFSSVEIWGGYSGSGGDCSGNTLRLDGYTGGFGKLHNFDSIIVVASLDNGGSADSAPSLTLPEGFEGNVGVELDFGGTGDSSASGSTLPMTSAPIAVGDKLVLVRGLNIKPTLTETELKVGRCAFLIYDLELGVETVTNQRNKAAGETYSITAMATGKSLNPQTKALAEGRIAAMQLNNRAGDLIAGQGVSQAKRAAQGKRVAAFFSMSTGHDKVDSGSHVDVDGIATMLGVSGSMTEQKSLTLGGFVESGWGDYSTHNGFAHSAVRGTGESSYVGGGLLLGYDAAHACKALKGVSLDASLRAGRQELDFGTFDMVNDHSPFTGYDADAHYVAGHAGVNYTVTPTERLTASAYARYLWNRLGSSKTKVCCEPMEFDGMSSDRLQFGLRAEYKCCEHWRPYIGLAYEWECSGKVRSRIHGMNVAAPDMRGGSLTGELGATWQPDAARPLWLNGGVQGVTGKRHGYGANVGCTVAF